MNILTKTENTSTYLPEDRVRNLNTEAVAIPTKIKGCLKKIFVFQLNTINL